MVGRAISTHANVQSAERSFIDEGECFRGHGNVASLASQERRGKMREVRRRRIRAVAKGIAFRWSMGDANAAVASRAGSR
jgi:hypothetical protein